MCRESIMEMGESSPLDTDVVIHGDNCPHCVQPNIWSDCYFKYAICGMDMYIVIYIYIYVCSCVCVRVHLCTPLLPHDCSLCSFQELTLQYILEQKKIHRQSQVWSQSSSTSFMTFEASQLFVSNVFTGKTGADPCSALKACWMKPAGNR